MIRNLLKRNKGPRYSQKERLRRGFVAWHPCADELRANDVLKVMGYPVYVCPREAALKANDLIAGLLASARNG